jgi:hypothetical protein
MKHFDLDGPNGSTIRLGRSLVRLLLAIEPEVGEALAAAVSHDEANPDAPVRRLRLELSNDAASLGTIRIPGVPDATGLTDQLGQLMRQLGDQAPATLQSGWLMITNAKYAREAIIPARRLARQGIVGLSSSENPKAALASSEKLFNAANWAEAALTALHMSGRTSSWFRSYASLVAAMADMPPRRFVLSLARVLDKSGAPPATILPGIISALCAEGADERVAHAAATTLERSSIMLKNAQNAGTIDDFHAELFRVMPNLISAWEMASLCSSGIAKHIMRYAEDDILRVMRSLHNAVIDASDLSQLQRYRLEIAALEGQQAAASAKRIATDLTELRMTYPAICKPFLLGQTVRPPRLS